MKVLITGGAGFIGSHVADAYLAQGAEVWVVDDFSTGRRANLSPGLREVVERSILAPEVRALCRTEGFDLVSHHAAQLDVRASVADPQFDAQTNLLGLLNLLEGIREGARRGGGAPTPKTRFVNISSGGVLYGDGVLRPTPEGASKAPSSPYGVAKWSAEVYLDYYRRIHGVEGVTLRYANVYGPRQDPHGEAGVVAIFSSLLLKGAPLTIFGDGEQTRDYLFVGDGVAANLQVGDLAWPVVPHSGGTGIDAFAYNVGTGLGTSVRALASTLERIAGREAPERIHASPRLGELEHSALSPAALQALGWSPAVTLDRGLQQTFEWIRNRALPGS
jgi:UDP-glucose 4-epimerase